MRLVCSCAIISFVWSKLTQVLNFRRCLPVLASSLKQSLRQHNSYSAFFDTKPDALNCTRWTYEKQWRFSLIQYVEIVRLSISANFVLEILKCACVSYCVCICVVCKCKYHIIHFPQGFSGIIYNTGWGTLPDCLRCSLQVMKEWVMMPPYMSVKVR